MLRDEAINKAAKYVVLVFGVATLFLFAASALFPHQSGFMSRWTGGAVELKAPEDCVRVVSFGRSDKVKWLSYVNSKGEVMLHEYTDRGYLEATYKIAGATFDPKTLNKDLEAK